MLYHSKDISLTNKVKSSEVETEYNKYFNGGSSSIYRKRFGKKLFIPNEKKIISKAYEYASCNFSKDKFKILDFGCGDGRLFNILENINVKNNQKIKYLEIICYDPSLNGIEILKNTLLSKNYKLEFIFEEILSSGYIKYKLSKNNISVVIIHANASDNFQKIKNLLGRKIDLAVLMFGVLSHIIGRENRKNILSTIKQCLSHKGILISNVPTKKHFNKDLIHYNYLRKNNYISALNCATEDGDIYYLRKAENEIIKNYYHIYNINELKHDIKEAGLSPCKFGISSINHTPALSNKLSYIIKIDTYFSRLFSWWFIPNSLKETIGSYIYCIAINKNDKKNI